MNQNQRGLNGFHLKLICITTMFIDHVAASLFMRYVMSGHYDIMTKNSFGMSLYDMYGIMRLIGRMAFPIYCFFIVEGFYYTKSKAKYALRLGIFALISEIPFDWAFNTFPKITENGISGLMPEFTYQNVFVTLLIGFLGIWAIDEIRKFIYKTNLHLAVKITLHVIEFAVIAFVTGIIASFAKTDYSATGVWTIIAIYGIYLTNGKDTRLSKLRRMIAFAVAVVILTLLSSITEAAALLMLLPMAFYNGTRGKQNKYFFYAFYPAHILLISIVGILLNYYLW